MSDRAVRRLEISGSYAPETAAAITAVIAEIMHEEAVHRAMPVRRPRPSAWVSATRSRDLQMPMRADSYAVVPWHHSMGESSAGDGAAT